MSDISVFQKHQKNIAKLAGNVLAFTANVPLNEGMTVEQQAQAITNAAKEDPMFESVDPLAVRQIAVPWAASVRGYIKQHGVNPPFDLLANAYNSMNNLIKSVAIPNTKLAGNGAAMLESAAKDMSTSQGVLKQAIFMAMVLPSQLGAATGDMCTFMPVERDENKFYEVYNIAGNDMGSFKKGQRMDQLSSGAFSQMGRIYKLDAATVDGIKTEYVIKVADQETKAMPVKPGRVRVLADGVLFKAFDDGDGNINVNEDHPKGGTYIVAGAINYDKGEVTLTFKEAPAKGTRIAIQAELDVENAPEIIPVINQAMKDWMMKPSQYILAAEHSVQSMMELQREFGLDLASMQFTSLTQWAAHEIDMKRLRKLAYHTIYDYSYDTALPEGQTWESWCQVFKTRVSSISRDVRDRTLKYGIRGGYAGGEAATFIKSLPSSLFTPAPGYVESTYVQFMGTLFGVYRIFEVPSPVCEQMTADGYAFDPADILWYSRGDNLGEAGMISGDAIPAIPFTHPTTPGLVNRQTLWGVALNEVHPRNGHAYFARLHLTNNKAGALNPVTGDYVGKPDGGVSEGFTADVSVQSVTMSPRTKSATVGTHFTLTPAFVPADATNQNYTLTSSDVAVVKINANNEPEAVGVGTADVTLTTEDGGYTAVTTVTVKAAS